MLERSMNRFERLDENGDGKLTSDEMEAARPQGPPPGDNVQGPGERRRGFGGGGFGLRRADANDDGVVTKEEFEAQTRERFKRMDTNGDGTVTPEEIQDRFAEGRRQRDGGE
jgi:Ca2+-binding EF-hand superfamily protein